MSHRRVEEGIAISSKIEAAENAGNPRGKDSWRLRGPRLLLLQGAHAFLSVYNPDLNSFKGGISS